MAEVKIATQGESVTDLDDDVQDGVGIEEIRRIEAASYSRD